MSVLHILLLSKEYIEGKLNFSDVYLNSDSENV